MVNDIKGKITNIKYTPFLCSTLNEHNLADLGKALETDASFLLNVDDTNKVAVSWWVSAKRTRSYPYSRVYNTLNFSGKRITIIPIFKDEGADGDRDFLQFDTVALMSLLNVHVVIAYYTAAKKSMAYDNKITSQRFDTNFLTDKIKQIISGQQSDALHWNMDELKNILEIGKRAIESYDRISKELNVKMTNIQKAITRIEEISESREHFLRKSREHAAKAQTRETQTTQPKESVDGTKGKITIENYLGGEYYFTVDETEHKGDDVLLIEAKHCKTENKLPSKDDIKDGLIKMILYSNLEEVTCNGRKAKSYTFLKLTNKNSNFAKLSAKENATLELLKKEAQQNNFQIIN